MYINIASNLKRLRKQREITQEDLADFIGVSFQAVSKWERGEGYPDITMLPVIANFFDVTIDELVGMNEIKNQAKVKEVKEQYMQLIKEGKQKESIELLRSAVKISPNNYELLAILASALFKSNGEEEKRKNGKEAVKIAERILEFCTDTKIRNEVQADMCLNLFNAGEQERAIELAMQLLSINYSKEKILTNILSGEEQKETSQEVIQWLANEFYTQIKWRLSEHYTDEEKLKIYQKSVDIYKIVHEEGDFGFNHNYLTHLYMGMATIYRKFDKIDEAIANLEKAAEHAIAYDILPEDGGERKSLLVNAIKWKSKCATGFEKNSAYLLKDWIIRGPDYELASDKRAKKILDKLSEYAN